MKKKFKNNKWYWLLLPGYNEYIPGHWIETEQHFICDEKNYNISEIKTIGSKIKINTPIVNKKNISNEKPTEKIF